MASDKDNCSGNPLVVIGAGGFVKEVLAAYMDHARTTASGPVLGLVDDDLSLRGTTIYGQRVLGDVRWLLDYGLHRVRCVVSVGNPRDRARIVDILDKAGAEYANVVHPTAILWGSLQACAGIVVQPRVLVSADTVIGRHVHLGGSTIVAHESQIREFATVGPLADINGRCVVEEGAYIGAQATLRQGVTVGSWATVGMCACVLEDVPPGATVVGVPAKIIRRSYDA